MIRQGATAGVSNSISIQSAHKVYLQRTPNKQNRRVCTAIEPLTTHKHKQQQGVMESVTAKQTPDWNRKTQSVFSIKRQMSPLKPYKMLNKQRIHRSPSISIHPHSGALSVHDRGTRLIVLLLLNPHLLEGGQRGQDGASDPDRVLPLRRSDDLNRHRVRGQILDFLLHSLRDVLVHRRAAAHHHVSVQILPDIDIALHDRREGQFVDSLLSQAQELRLEQSLRRSEPLRSDGDHLTIRQFVILLDLARGLCGLHFLIEIQCDVAQLLLDITHNLLLGRGGERVSSLRQDLLKISRDVTSGQIQSLHGVRQTVSLVDWHSVSHSITRIQHNSRGSPRSVQGKHRLDRHVECRGVERLEHDLSHLLAVRLGVQRGLGQQDRVLLGGDTQLIIESVVPHLLHVVPVVHDAVLHRVFQRQNTPLCLRLISDVAVLLPHSHHHALMTWASHNRWKHRSGRIISGESSLHHTGSIVNHTSCGFLVHDDLSDVDKCNLVKVTNDGKRKRRSK